MKFKHISLKNIFIKFDGKITFNIDEFLVKTTSDNTNRRPKKLNKYLLLNLYLFKDINIKNLTYNNNKFSILYNKKTLFMRHEDFRLTASVIEIDKDYIKLNSVLKINNTKIPTSTTAIITIHTNKDLIEFDGLSKVEKINIPFSGKVMPNKMAIKMSTNEIKSLKPLSTVLNIQNKGIDEWLYKRIACESYKIKDLQLSFDNNFYHIAKDLTLRANCNKAIINYKDKVKPVTASNIKISIKNQDLKFDLIKPISNKIPINGSYVVIYNIFNNGVLDVFLKAENIRFNKKIKEILKAYDIDVPITQLERTANLQLHIFLPLNGEQDTNIIGKVDAINTRLLIKDKMFYIKKANLLIDNSFINIKDINISDDIFEGVNTSDIIIDTNKQTLNGNVDISKISLYKERNNIENIQSDLFIDFNKSKILFKDLDFSIDMSKKNTIITANNISKLKLQSLFDGIFHGNAKVEINDYGYTADISLDKQTLPFLYQEKPIKNINLSLKYNKKTKNTTLANDNIKAIFNKDEIFIEANKIDTNLTKLIQLMKEGDNVHIPIHIRFNKTNILLKKHKLEFDNIDVGIEDNEFKIDAKHKKGKVSGNIKKSKLDIKGTNLNSHFINKALNEDIFKGGLFNINMKNDNIKDKGSFYGNLSTIGTKIKNINTFANIFSIINISPMGFSNKGLSIEEGNVSYATRKDNLLVDDFSIFSDSVNITGKGILNLDSKEINFYLKTSILKTLSTITKNLPIIGYIILGDNNDININIIAKGKIQSPDIQLDANQDILTQPLEMVIRTLKLPEKIIKDIFK